MSWFALVWAWLGEGPEQHCVCHGFQTPVYEASDLKDFYCSDTLSNASLGQPKMLLLHRHILFALDCMVPVFIFVMLRF